MINPWKGPQFRFKCPHCGRIWDASKRNAAEVSAGISSVGFIRSGANNHIHNCATKTPAERRLTNRRDEKRWAKSPPSSCSIKNNPNHPGLKETPNDHM